MVAQMSHDVLNHGPIYHRQHLLWNVRSQRTKASSQSPDEDNGLHGPTG